MVQQSEVPGPAGSTELSTTPLRVGNASGFYGDRFAAWQEMLDGGSIDILTGDYLAELTMLILGRDQRADPSAGYAKTFLRQMEQCLGMAVDQGVRIVTNAGGVNPAGLAEALRKLATRLGLTVRIGHVEGDTVVVPEALAAHAYLGGFGIAACLRSGADVVVTGRVTDASLVVGPAVAHFGWARDDLDALAGATVAGHLLECGAQVTGGNFAFFTELGDRMLRPGLPIAEIYVDGSTVVTKHTGTGGAVTLETVTAQLLYEVGSPAYLGPDVVTHLDTVGLTDDGPDRVRVCGVRGSAPPDTLKLGVTSLGGYRNAMSFVLCGLDIEAKATLVRSQLESLVGAAGLTWRLARTDHPDADTIEAACALLTVHIRDQDPARAGRAFSQAVVELALSSYPGCTLTTPPGEASPYGIFRGERIPQASVAHTAVSPTGTRIPIPAPTTMAVADPPAGTAIARTDRGRTGGAGHPSDTDGAGHPSDTGGAGGPDGARSPGATRRVPLGTVVGARSGDKGGDANLGVWARSAAGYAWLRDYLDVAELRRLLPECAPLRVDRYELANLYAVNFVIHGLLGEGVAASTRFDPQAKALGEWLRSRLVDVPQTLLSRQTQPGSS